MYLIDMIFYWARVDPQRHALIQREAITTYQALAQAIESISVKIERLGLDRREPIAVSIVNPSLFVAIVFAVLRCGYSAALVRPALLPLLPSAGIRNLIYDTQGLILSGGRNIRFDLSWISDGNRLENLKNGASSSAEVIFFTSGTTGLPKKVIQAAEALTVLLNYPLTCASGPGEKILIMPALSSTLGFNRLCEVLNAGKAACFAANSASALALIDIHRVEVAVTSVAQAFHLAKTWNENPSYRVDSLTALFAGGGKILPEAIATIRSALCRNVINQYGSTEAGVVALTPFDFLNDTPGIMPLPWAELQVVDNAGQLVPSGAEGYVRYRTPQLAENLKRLGPDVIAGVRDGWFYPGDIGTVTDQGIVRLADRSSDVINRGGVKVSGTRIEQILRALPKVKDVAACGIVGESGLEEIWIAVVSDDAIDRSAIDDLLRSHPAIGLAPDEVLKLDQLPRGELGKVQMGRLKELLLNQKKAA